MRKLIIAVLVSGSLLGGIGVAKADPPQEPGRDYGRCTSFFNGKKEGHEKQKDRNGTYPGPFQDALDAAPDGPDEGTDPGSVSDYYNECANGAGIGGNPADNGRFTGCFNGDSPDDEDTDPCND